MYFKNVPSLKPVFFKHHLQGIDNAEGSTCNTA